MKSMRKSPWITILLLFGFVLTSCDTLAGSEDNALSASGIVEVTEVSVSAEIGGKVAQVWVAEGEEVETGSPLFRMEDELLQAQRSGALAALEAAKAQRETAVVARSAAEAAVESAQIAVDAADLQLQQALVLARMSDFPNRRIGWDRDLPSEFSLPPWYFTVSERIEAAEAEVEAAAASLKVEREYLDGIIDEAGSANFSDVEQRLSQAQAAFVVIEALADKPVDARGRKYVKEFVDDLHEAANAELESAQEAYDSLLSEAASEEVLEARARFIVAQERHRTALDALDLLMTGEHSLEVQAAMLMLRQAESQRVQAEIAVAQAEAQLLSAERAVDQAHEVVGWIDLQLERLTVEAPVAGVVMTRSVEPGEMLQPGIVALTIGQLDELRVTVYLPEDRYGLVSLGDRARLSVDSYPDEDFEAVVTRIADRAEFTPRNVQTEEDRRTTVYAIELTVVDPAGKLKPGMPADVTFSS